MPPRQLTDDELETIRLTEASVDRRPPLERASATHLKPVEGQVKLYCPDHRACSFGPGNSTAGTTHDLIQFGEVEDHVAIIPADHPLLPLLRRMKPQVVVLEPGEEFGKVYTCEDCDREFPSKRLLSQHRKGGHKKAKAPVEAPLSDPVEPDEG